LYRRSLSRLSLLGRGRGGGGVSHNRSGCYPSLVTICSRRGSEGFPPGYQQGVEAIVIHGFLWLRMDYRGSSSVGGSVSSASTPFTPHLGRVAVLHISRAPTHASGIAFRSSISSAFAPGTAICGSPSSISHPSSASEENPQVRLIVESTFDSCAFSLDDMAAGQNIQLR